MMITFSSTILQTLEPLLLEKYVTKEKFSNIQYLYILLFYYLAMKPTDQTCAFHTEILMKKKKL